jgi:metallothiol transferase
MIVIEGFNYTGITVSDLERSIEFYRDILDFDYLDRVSDEERAYMAMGDIIIALIRSEGYRAEDTASSRISFYVDEEDFDDIADEIEEKELPLSAGPGERGDIQFFIITDPDNNKIEITAPRIQIR